LHESYCVRVSSENSKERKRVSNRQYYKDKKEEFQKNHPGEKMLHTNTPCEHGRAKSRCYECGDVPGGVSSHPSDESLQRLGRKYTLCPHSRVKSR
jgi:hypothetical protein